MMARVASRAPTTAPDTGASTKWILFDSSTTPSARVPIGSEELMSTTTLPVARWGIAASTASRTASPSGSMVISASAPRAASRIDLQLPLPLRSNDCTANPARSRFAAMGAPIVPRPMKATLLTTKLLFGCEYLFGGAEGDDRRRHAAVDRGLQQD